MKPHDQQKSDTSQKHLHCHITNLTMSKMCMQNFFAFMQNSVALIGLEVLPKILHLTGH